MNSRLSKSINCHYHKNIYVNCGSYQITPRDEAHLGLRIMSPIGSRVNFPFESITDFSRSFLDTPPESDWHPNFRFCWDYWARKCCGEKFPDRSDIDPLEVTQLLSAIAIVDVERDPLRFWYRLTGENISRIHGAKLSKHYVDEIKPKIFSDTAHNDLAELVSSKEPQFVELNFENREKVKRSYRVLRLPLSQCDLIDHILVWTDYQAKY
jgi:hypothetical protein